MSSFQKAHPGKRKYILKCNENILKYLQIHLYFLSNKSVMVKHYKYTN